MPSNKRTAHLLPAGIAGLCATVALTAALVGTAAAAPAQDFGAHDYRGAQDFRAAESDAGMSALSVPVQDFGSQDFRGAQDFRSAESAAALSAADSSGQGITDALQPGQTVASMTSSYSGGSVGDQAPWEPASGPTSALQPGQTNSLVTAGSGPASGPTSALQPGQTDSQVVARIVGYDPAHEHLTSAPWPTSAPQPGQTGW